MRRECTEGEKSTRRERTEGEKNMRREYTESEGNGGGETPVPMGVI